MKKVATFARFFVYTRTLLKLQKSIKVCPPFRFQQPLCQTNFKSKSMLQNIYK